MKLNITLIRCGLTQGGKDGRFLGQCDEALLEEERKRIAGKAALLEYPGAELIYSSRLLRCRQTAGLIYPTVPAVVMGGLEDLDLGRYTNLQYHEILQGEEYDRWAKSPNLQPFPGGEPPHEAHSRAVRAFRQVAEEMLYKGIAEASIVTHRLIIAAILYRFHMPRNSYRDWTASHGGGFTLRYDSLTLTATVNHIF